MIRLVALLLVLLAPEMGAAQMSGGRATGQSPARVSTSVVPATDSSPMPVAITPGQPAGPSVAPPLDGLAASNPLRTRAALKAYCYQNLAGCAPPSGGLR